MTKLSPNKKMDEPVAQIPEGLFSIHLIEGPDGCVSAVCEIVGMGPNAIEIGLEIMDKLETASRLSPGRLLVQPLTRSSQFQ
jgi:hypothetical protein